MVRRQRAARRHLQGEHQTQRQPRAPPEPPAQGLKQGAQGRPESIRTCWCRERRAEERREEEDRDEKERSGENPGPWKTGLGHEAHPDTQSSAGWVVMFCLCSGERPDGAEEDSGL